MGSESSNLMYGACPRIIPRGSSLLPRRFKLKIIVGFLQITTNLSFVVEVPWPAYYRSFLDLFSFVNLDFLPWQSLGCATVSPAV
jgi:hypothetical protein